MNLTTGVARGKNQNDTTTGSIGIKVTKEGHIIGAAGQVLLLFTHTIRAKTGIKFVERAVEFVFSM